jgi:hypothetical protein
LFSSLALLLSGGGGDLAILERAAAQACKYTFLSNIVEGCVCVFVIVS